MPGYAGGYARGRCTSSRGAAVTGARRAACRGRDAASARCREAHRGEARRIDSPVSQRRRQEPVAAIRGRARAAQPPADERTLARRAARRAPRRVAVAHPARRCVRGRPLERARARAPPRHRHLAPRPRHPRRPARRRRDDRADPHDHLVDVGRVVEDVGAEVRDAGVAAELEHGPVPEDALVHIAAQDEPRQPDAARAARLDAPASVHPQVAVQHEPALESQQQVLADGVD